MATNWPTVGEHYTPAYQISSVPFITSSVISNGEVHRYEFPYVTRFVNVLNRGTGSDEICVSFSENGLKPSVGNFNTLDKGFSMGGEFRTTTLFVSCSSGTNVKYNLLCGLTSIPADRFLLLTGSNGYSGIG